MHQGHDNVGWLDDIVAERQQTLDGLPLSWIVFPASDIMANALYNAKSVNSENTLQDIIFSALHALVHSSGIRDAVENYVRSY